MASPAQLLFMIDTLSLYDDAVSLLRRLIAIPSFSRTEEGTATLLQQWFGNRGIKADRLHHNVYASNLHFDKRKPTLLLNSHHDTVKPAKGYTRDPFDPVIEDGRLYGLGSNDAGASLVSLMAVFCYYYRQENMKYNLILAATAEEEISGTQGIASLLQILGKIDSAIVGEPTLLHMAVAERGLMVIDTVVKGIAGHAARNEGVNAIYEAMKVITVLQQYDFGRVSDFLGKVSLNITSMETENKAHNVVPDNCRFTMDIRLNECYTHEEVLDIIKSLAPDVAFTARSMRLKSSIIPCTHPLVKAGTTLGLNSYGSPTLSDKALMPFPALKLGPGDSARSHTADEFINLSEIRKGIDTYIVLIQQLSL